jgi:thiol-disulfide isomerase/thioredoxin
MDNPTRPSRLGRKLDHYARTKVPATVDLWPAIRRTLLTPAQQSGIFNSGGADSPSYLSILRARAQHKENGTMSRKYESTSVSDGEFEEPVEGIPVRPRRPPTAARIHVEPAPSEAPAPAARSNMPVIMGIVGVGGLVALLLVAMIFNNLSHKGDAATGSGGTVATGPEDVVPGSLAVDFTATNLVDGKVVHVSDYRGKNPVWLNFWASWCGPCKAEMPDMQQLYDANKAKGLVILGFDVREDQKTVSDFVTSRAFNWTFLLQPNGETANRYYVSGIPTHIFIGKDGVIKSRVSSGLPRSYMEAELAKILL